MHKSGESRHRKAAKNTNTIYIDANGRPFRTTRKGITSKPVRYLVNILITAAVGAGLYYWALPACNPQSGGFWAFIAFMCIFFMIVSSITAGGQKPEKGIGKLDLTPRIAIPIGIIVVVILVAIIGAIYSAPIFHAKSYSQLLQVETSGDFSTDVEELSFDQIPLLDYDSASQLGSRKLGELSDMVSQFEVGTNYTQINYNGKPVRVTPLVYGDFIKWINNTKQGIPAYLIINMTTSNVQVVRLTDGMKYSTAEHFNRNLYRYLRFQYPTYLFEEPQFEIDEDGVPYWVCAHISKRIGLFGGTDITGAVLVNAVTGETEYYTLDTIPEWVDRVFNASLIMEQYDSYGKYHNGFLNSIFGQRDVTVTTDGYNYIAQGDDVYMYTGITSVTGDASNIGFILCNQRTKECNFYACAGAEESSAMTSAEGILQQMHYVATFPILLNISGEPTYFMAMKDSGGLVKQYAMVNMQQYQIVANGTTVQNCLAAYLALMEENGLTVTTEIEETDTATVSGTVEEIRSAVLNGNTIYYFSLQEEPGVYFSISASDCEVSVLVSTGDKVTVKYEKGDGPILKATDLEISEKSAGVT